MQPGSGACAEEATRPHLVYSEKMAAVRMMSQEGPDCPGPKCPGPKCPGPNCPGPHCPGPDCPGPNLPRIVQGPENA